MLLSLNLRARTACLVFALGCSGFAFARQPASPYEKAQRLREALEGRSEQQRTRRDYERVLAAYRAVYHGDPASRKADASIAAVAELLAEQGRVFQDEKSLRDAIGQYEFLRHQYPGSRYRVSALLTEGEIYRRDLNEPQNAKGEFKELLKLYPASSQAAEARQELKQIKKEQAALRHGRHAAPAPIFPPAESAPARRETARSEAEPAAATRRKPMATAAGFGMQGAAATGASATDRAAFGRPEAATAGSGRAGTERIVTERAVPERTGTERAGTARPDTERVGTERRGTAEPAAPALSEAALNAPPPPRRAGRVPLITGIRHWSTPVYTRVAIDLQDEVQYEAARVPNPDRIFFDLHGAKLSPELIGKSVEVTDGGYLKRIRAAQFSNDVTRIVLDVSDVSEYSAFFLPNPSRLIIDIHGGTGVKASAPALVAAAPPAARMPLPSSTAPARTSSEEVASLGQQRNRIRATKRPTTAPVAATVAGTTPAPQPAEQKRVLRAEKAEAAQSEQHRNELAKSEPPADIRPAGPTASGDRSLVRTLGLKINRIVVDAGHGGHDSGTLGPGGIEEKDVVLDVALRLGKLLKQRLGADVIYTRDDDTFIPLETRTAIANKAQADLFISVHANSSHDPSARGVETYYLNFTSSADALEVAARENAVSDESIHQLSDLVKKIALQDKISESREFAFDVEQSLYTGLEQGNGGLKDRGVKKAPFVVLIGANMPSILAEISFLTNPEDAHELREPAYRERIAESLYQGTARYIGSLSGVRLAEATAPHTTGN